MTPTVDLQPAESSVSCKHGVSDMLVNWIDVRTKATHFGALVLAWFWSEYTFDEAFRNGVTQWAHGLNPYWRGLFGASISFILWYKNPKKME